MANITITAANVKRVSGRIKEVTAGASVSTGHPVYEDSTDGNEHKHALDTSLAASAAVGIVLSDGADGQKVVIQEDGVIEYGDGVFAVGQVYVVSGTAGIAPHTDLASTNWITVVGVAITDKHIELNIYALGKTLA